MKTIFFYTFLISMVFSLAACENKEEPTVQDTFCDAAQSLDYDAMGQEIDDYLDTLEGTDWKVNVNKLEDWLNEKDCVLSAVALEDIIETLPLQTELIISLDVNEETVEKKIDLYFEEDSGELWFHRFHD